MLTNSTSALKYGIYWFTHIRQSIQPFVRPSVIPSYVFVQIYSSVEDKNFIFGKQDKNGKLDRFSPVGFSSICSFFIFSSL